MYNKILILITIICVGLFTSCQKEEMTSQSHLDEMPNNLEMPMTEDLPLIGTLQTFEKNHKK